jgi:hypothetical protein
MSPISISLIVFVCVFGGALCGLALRSALPEHHRSAESKELVKSAMALIGTISALVLGLLVASAKGSYDTQRDELSELSAKIAILDRVLAHYGPETKAARELLRGAVANAVDRLWRNGSSRPSTGAEVILDKIVGLSPKDDAQRELKGRASDLMMDIGKTRWMMFAQSGSSISAPLLVVVVFWLTVNFISFGLFANRNATVTAALFVCALSVAGAIFLILEMDRPFEGLIRISDAPLRDTLAHLGHL